MAFDGIVTRAVAHELNERLATGRIMKIYQPTDTEIVMQVRTRRGNVRLLLSASLSFPRIHMTNASYQNPLEAPMFCMLLRKYCEGAIKGSSILISADATSSAMIGQSGSSSRLWGGTAI
jgi:predicted ribosome quality control (RQC) complex YloA/Tae2 family protein